MRLITHFFLFGDFSGEIGTAYENWSKLVSKSASISSSTVPCCDELNRINIIQIRFQKLFDHWWCCRHRIGLKGNLLVCFLLLLDWCYYQWRHHANLYVFYPLVQCYEPFCCCALRILSYKLDAKTKRFLV